MRCKCCDNVLEEREIIWLPDKGIHEELCLLCRRKVFDYSFDADMADKLENIAIDNIYEE